MKTYCYVILLVSVLAVAGCSPAAETNSTPNDTSRLNSMAQKDQKSAEFAKAFELYYQSLQKKDWPTSYDMRTANFKKDVTRDVYLKEMADHGENLTSYKVLNVRLYGGTNGDYTAAEIIMEFNEGGMVSYSCARWIKRGGNWTCDEPGLSGSGFLTSTRIPDWITD
jgi:hypothetical protein